MTRRAGVFAGIAGVSVIAAIVYVFLAAERGEDVRGRDAGVARVVLPPLDSAPVSAGEQLVFLRRSGLPDGADGSIGVAPLAATTDARFARLKCERVHMSGGHGVCLAKRGRFPVSYVAVLFDGTFSPTGVELPLVGAPSRAQVAPSGRFAAVTAFVAGHSYSDNSFSTRTSILDFETGTWIIEDMEQLEVKRDGVTIHAPDFNFWGVTFFDDSHSFLATLGTAGRTFLVKGDVGSHELNVVDTDIECPSISPDNQRLAFKHRNPGRGPLTWRLWVMDLATHERHVLADTRNVDDQAQWLDNDRVAYALNGTKTASLDVWAVRADGSGSPERILAGGNSAFVSRR